MQDGANEKLLIYWLNSLDMISCLSANTVDDLRDGSAFTDMGQFECDASDIADAALTPPLLAPQLRIWACRLTSKASRLVQSVSWRM